MPVSPAQNEVPLALLLMHNLGRPLSREPVREAVRGHDPEIRSRMRDAHASSVRWMPALGPETGCLLVPLHGCGYRLEQLSRSGTDGPTPQRGPG